MSEFNYLEVAKSAIKSINSVYYNSLGDYKGNHFWNRAEMIEMIEDAYDIIGEEYKTQLANMCNVTLTIHKKEWSNNPFYDDLCWMCIAFARASKILENTEYLEIAKTNLDYLWENSRYEDGAMAWKRGVKTKHAITSCTFSIAACVIGSLLNDDSYFEKAIEALDYVINKLSNMDEGKVYDKIYEDGVYDYASYSYLQGTFIGACCLLHEYTGDDKYKEYATKAVEYTLTEVFTDGLMNNYREGDGAGFKGILARYIRMYAKKYDSAEHLEWLRTHAQTAWENRNKFGLMQNNLYEKTRDHTKFTAWDCHSAVSVCINAI